MSKNTASNAFRKIDVDAFNEDNFRDEDTAGTGPQPGQGGAVASEAQIGTWIQEGKTVEALQALLSQAPISNKNQQEKVRKLGQDLLSVSISSHMHLSRRVNARFLWLEPIMKTLHASALDMVPPVALLLTLPFLRELLEFFLMSTL